MTKNRVLKDLSKALSLSFKTRNKEENSAKVDNMAYNRFQNMQHEKNWIISSIQAGREDQTH